MIGKYLLVINTGSTTTKCSIYFINSATELDLFSANTIEHPDDLFNRFPSISDQIDYREKLVRSFFDVTLPVGADVLAVGALGGMLPPVPSGLISLNRELSDFSLKTPVYEHASNLGATLAFRIASTMKAFP